MNKLLCFLLLAALVSFAAAADVTGNWSGTWSAEGREPGTAYLVLKQNGSSVTGTAGPSSDVQWPLEGGKFNGTQFQAHVTDPDGILYKVSMSLNGNKMAGDMDVVAGGQT